MTAPAQDRFGPNDDQCLTLGRPPSRHKQPKQPIDPPSNKHSARSLKATIDYLLGTLGGAIYAGTVAALIPHPTQIARAGVLAIAVAPLALLAAINSTFGAATFTGVLVLLVPGIAHVGPVESAISGPRGRRGRLHRTCGIIPGVANARPCLGD
jgi:hypothetical protein